MKDYFFKKTLFFSVIFVALVFLFSQCKKDPIKGWTFFSEAPPPPEIIAMGSIVSNCEPPYPVTFNQKSINLIGNVNYAWDFGDGNTSNLQNPHHIYQVPGNYNVRLIVSNEVGADTAYLDMSALSQASIPVEAEFNYSHYNNNNFAPTKVNFYNTSNGANQFYWLFGDGNQSNAPTTENIFLNAGTYTVTLKGTCTNGSFDETTRSVFVIPAPQRVFIDSITLMLPSAYRNNGIYIDLYHNTTLVGSTVTKSPSSYPVKFKRPNDFMQSYFFDFVQYTNNEVFEFWIMKDNGVDPPFFINKIVLASVDIQQNHYPKSYISLKPIPPITDMFIDLYISY